MKKEDAITNPFLSFGLGAELFAFDFSKVITILDRNLVTKLHFSHQYLVGKINLDGCNLPVVDLRKKLNIVPTNVGNETGILVLKLDNSGEQKDVGILVDFIKDIIEFNPSNIYPAPDHGSLYESGIVNGMGKFLKNYYLLLNINKLLTTGDVEFFNEIISSKELEYAC
ncbi:MAG: purine-binding chemotaxis protein CheW [Salinivirgaceae bacterium]|nr:purine-binding chemotaxis protein CheW [Salinivirgaceae bacterium]